MTNEEAVNVLRIMASGIELKGFNDNWIKSFRTAYEKSIKAIQIVDLIEKGFKKDNNLMIDSDDWEDIKEYIEK